MSSPPTAAVFGETWILLPSSAAILGGTPEGTHGEVRVLWPWSAEGPAERLRSRCPWRRPLMGLHLAAALCRGPRRNPWTFPDPKRGPFLRPVISASFLDPKRVLRPVASAPFQDLKRDLRFVALAAFPNSRRGSHPVASAPFQDSKRDSRPVASAPFPEPKRGLHVVSLAQSLEGLRERPEEGPQEGPSHRPQPRPPERPLGGARILVAALRRSLRRGLHPIAALRRGPRREAHLSVCFLYNLKHI